MPYRKVMKEVKKMRYSISVAAIHRKGAIRENICKTGKTCIFPKRPTSAIVDVVRKIRNMVKLVNTQKEMASKCGASIGTEIRIISKYLKAKLRKSADFIV